MGRNSSLNSHITFIVLQNQPLTSYSFIKLSQKLCLQNDRKIHNKLAQFTNSITKLNTVRVEYHDNFGHQIVTNFQCKLNSKQISNFFDFFRL